MMSPKASNVNAGHAYELLYSCGGVECGKDEEGEDKHSIIRDTPEYQYFTCFYTGDISSIMVRQNLLSNHYTSVALKLKGMK